MTNGQQRQSVRGIHHITAISSNPQQTVDFYTELLGLRMVKLTVNFDDPSTYHLYFGDRSGRPGTILTFFPFPLASRGKPGLGQVTAVAFRVPPESLDFWAQRLSRHGIDFEGPFERFGKELISFSDSDGLPLELVAAAGNRSDWLTPDVPAENAIVEFDGVTLSLTGYESTAKLIENQLGMTPVADEGNRFRFQAGSDQTGIHNVDLLCLPDGTDAVPGAGTVHHIAWRCRVDEQENYRMSLAESGYNVTPVLDRNYFRSIYFREPGGIQFEIATDEPGFSTDEEVDELGSSLKLPDWLESRRPQIERSLPPMKYTPQVPS